MKTQRIFERELNACFQTFYGYAFATFVLLTAGIYTVLSCLKGGSADFTQVPRSMTFTFLIAIPILIHAALLPRSAARKQSCCSTRCRSASRRSWQESFWAFAARSRCRF